MFYYKITSQLSHILAFLIILLVLDTGCSPKKLGNLVTSEKVAESSLGMVVTAHPLASEVGRRILSKGGNAVDAAVAVHFALAVVYPVAGNIGGGGFMIYRSNEGEVSALDFREMAPGSASRDMYLDENGDVIKGKSQNGHLACGVPGSVDGMIKAHARYGKMPFPELIQPAIELARDGFQITAAQAKRFNSYQERFKQYNFHTTQFQKEAYWKTGDLLVQTDLSNTLLRISLSGRDGFYRGQTAEYVVAEMQKGGGIISMSDMANYESKWRQPVLMNYKGHSLISMPPSSSGGIALAQMLGMIADKNIGDLGFHTQASVHLMAEVERRAFADRAEHLGDSDFYNVPRKEILASSYLKKRMEDFDPNKASSSEEVDAGMLESEETTHYSIVDSKGNAVSITTTINTGFGSKTVVEGAGFFLNNEMDDFSVKPGHPNFFGLVGNEANAIEPKKRMLSSMTPSIVTKDGALYMVVGTPGGSTIITSVFQVFLNVADFGLTLPEAVAAGRFHHQWLPDMIFHEKGALPQETIDGLKAMGHAIKERGTIGKVDAIIRLENGNLQGAADPRGDDHAAGVKSIKK